MKLLFMGTPDFARSILVSLLESRHDVVGVVSGIDKKSGRGGSKLPTSVAELAQSRGIPLLRPASLRDPSLPNQLAAFEAELFVVAAFRILPASLFELPAKGSINIHTSLLPRYRGAAPIHWAIINGEKETGLTSFFLKDQVDSGDMILQETMTIEPTDTFDSLHERMARLAGPFALRTIDLIESNSRTPLLQDQTAVTLAPKITEQHARIDFDQPAVVVKRWIMGLSTRPGAVTTFRGKRLKLHRAALAELSTPPAEAGTVRIESGRMLVACSDGWVDLQAVVPEGKREMDGRAFINGYRPVTGEKMGESA